MVLPHPVVCLPRRRRRIARDRELADRGHRRAVLEPPRPMGYVAADEGQHPCCDGDQRTHRMDRLRRHRTTTQPHPDHAGDHERRRHGHCQSEMDAADEGLIAALLYFSTGIHRLPLHSLDLALPLSSTPGAAILRPVGPVGFTGISALSAVRAAVLSIAGVGRLAIGIGATSYVASLMTAQIRRHASRRCPGSRSMPLTGSRSSSMKSNWCFRTRLLARSASFGRVGHLDQLSGGDVVDIAVDRG